MPIGIALLSQTEQGPPCCMPWHHAVRQGGFRRIRRVFYFLFPNILTSPRNQSGLSAGRDVP